MLTACCRTGLRMRRCAAVGFWVAVYLVGAVSLAAERQPLQIEDLYRHDAASDVQLLPEGKQAVYVREWAEPGFLYRRSTLWLSDAMKSETRALEPGQPDARRPVVSPDGRWIAFLSTRAFPDGTPVVPDHPVWSDPATDVWLISVDGGRAIPLAGPKKPYGRVFSDPFYGRVAFSPNGKQLVFVADDGSGPRTPEEKTLDITIVREDQGEGYDGFGQAAIWVADLDPEAKEVAARSVRCVAKGGWYGDPQWTRDGDALIVHANIRGRRESVRFSINQNFDLLKIVLKSGEILPLTTAKGPQVSPRVSPDGRYVVYLSVPRNGPHSDIYNLELIDLEKPGAPRVLYDHHQAKEPAPHDPPSFPLPADCWLDDRWIVMDVPRGVRTERQIVDTRSERGERFSGDPESHSLYAERQAARARHAIPSQAYLKERIVADDDVFRWRGRDGRDLDGVLTLPAGEGSRKPFPLVLFPHGGPHSRSTVGFNFTAQLFAARGYAVFQPNFRGSVGYGKEFLDADRKDLGGGDMQDILSGIDALVEQGIVDRDRQFVYGVSYGGFMTCWLIGHTHQFRAAVPQNAVTEMNVMWGVGDLQSWTEWEVGGKPWEVAEAMRRHSPFTYVHKVKTPTLILHADKDRRCPLAMGQMYYRGLKEVGTTAEMVIYHNERHGISRLDHQADIYRRTLDWFARHDAPGNSPPSR